MPDIAMCKGEDCPLKNECYRYTAIPCDYQSYFCDPPYIDDECEFFYKDLKKVKQKRNNGK